MYRFNSQATIHSLQVTHAAPHFVILSAHDQRCAYLRDPHTPTRGGAFFIAFIPEFSKHPDVLSSVVQRFNTGTDFTH